MSSTNPHQHALGVSLPDATLSYEGSAIFSNLSFTLVAGKWTCLLGPSGVGKTSVLRVFAGLQSDVVLPEGITTSDGLPLNNRLAYLTQHDSLLPWLSVLDNVLIGFRLRGETVTPEVREQACHLLERVGLSGVLTAKPDQLSGGMRQRVSLARTLMEDKPVVMMDEPFSSLDAITRVQLQTLAAELLVNKTVLLVTHDILEALRLGDHVFVLQGSPAGLFGPIDPPGKAPRDIADPAMLQLQARLLEQLHV